MKNIYFLALAFFTTGLAFGQVVDIHLDSDPGTMVNGTTLDRAVDHPDFQVKMHVTNISGSAANWKFGREILSQSSAFTDQFCDDFLCYNCTGNPWVSSSVAALAAGDSSTFKPQITLNSGQSAVIRYYVLDADNGDAKIDSVDINFTSAVGIEEIDVALTAYPNPATDNFFINFQGNQGVNFNLVVYNVAGSEVLRRTITNGITKMDVSDMDNGVYFYSIITSGEVLETKKLIIRH